MSIYQNIFDLLVTYVYGGVSLTPDMNLVCTLVSTIACLFCVAIPFVIVFYVIKFITGNFI